MDKYLARIHLQGNRGTYAFSSDSLDEIRTWANSKGVKGDTLRIYRNGTSQVREIAM